MEAADFIPVAVIAGLFAVWWFGIMKGGRDDA